MLSGRPAFQGATVGEVLADVLTREPAYADVPIGARSAVRRCLEKNSANRLRDAADAIVLIEEHSWLHDSDAIPNRWPTTAWCRVGRAGGWTLGGLPVASAGFGSKQRREPTVHRAAAASLDAARRCSRLPSRPSGVGQSTSARRWLVGLRASRNQMPLSVSICFKYGDRDRGRVSVCWNVRGRGRRHRRSCRDRRCDAEDSGDVVAAHRPELSGRISHNTA